MTLPGWIGTGKTFGTAQDFSNWVDSTPQADVQKIAKDFGVSADDFTNAYNAGKGTSFTSDIGGQWLGYDPNVNTDGNGVDLFQPDLYPKTESTSNSRSGLSNEYVEPIMGSVIPQFASSINGLSGAPDKYSENAQEMANASSKEALKFAGQNVLESMASKNMLNSSITGDVMGRAIGDVAKNTQNLGYQAGKDASEMKLTIPQILSSLAQLGNVSESASSSLSEQPNVPYQNAMQLMLGMM